MAVCKRDGCTIQAKPHRLFCSHPCYCQSRKVSYTCPDCGAPRQRISTRCQPCDVKRRGAARVARATAASAPPIAQPLRLSFEEAWRQWQKTIGMATDRYRGPGKKVTGQRRRVAVLPDLHAPFHDRALFADFVARESGVADKVICAGDLGDAYAFSRFLKYERMPYRDEWAAITLVTQTLSEAFSEVDVLLGNHDARLERQLRERLSEDMVDAVTCLTGGILCPITALAKRYPNVTVKTHDVPKTDMSVHWLGLFGDAIVLHAERFSKVPGSVLRAVDDWISDNRLALNLGRPRLIIQAHTHQLGVFPWHADKLLVECGCLCATQGYMTSARIGGRPQRRGYIWFEQVDGVTDLNSVGWHWYDAEPTP